MLTGLNFGTLDMVAVGQVFGIVLSVVGFFIYLAKTRKGILIAKLTCDAGYCIQQLMLGATTGALINCIAIFRDVVFYYRNDKKWAGHRFWLYFFAVVMGLTPVLTWMGPVSLLPAVGSVVAVFAFYCQKPQHTRILSLGAMIPWMLYAFLITNYGLMLTTIIQIVSAVLGLIRDYRANKR